MMDMEQQVKWAIFLSGLFLGPILLFVPAPYGRFSRPGFGFMANGKLAWLLFESVPVYALPVSLFHHAQRPLNACQWILFLLWETHYIHRSVIYTYNAPSMKPTALLNGFFAVVFNAANGYINGKALLSIHLNNEWLLDARFLLGLTLFLTGMYINSQSDYALFALREAKKGPSSKSRYFIPRGGLFEFVSSPSYFGEILEWIGWAVATWSQAGALFAFFTASNLMPRGMATHSWYKKEFKSYPKDRKAVIPFVL